MVPALVVHPHFKYRPSVVAVFFFVPVSGDELDMIARRLGGKRMSASGIVENMVKHHLTVYGDELKEWYKL